MNMNTLQRKAEHIGKILIGEADDDVSAEQKARKRQADNQEDTEEEAEERARCEEFGLPFKNKKQG